MTLTQLRATATVHTAGVFPVEAPTYLGVKASKRARKFEIEFVFDEAASARRGEGQWWMKLRDGNHTVGLFGREVVRRAYADAVGDGALILTSTATA